MLSRPWQPNLMRGEQKISVRFLCELLPEVQCRKCHVWSVSLTRSSVSREIWDIEIVPPRAAQCTPHQTPHVVLLCWEREVREVIGSVTLCHLMTDHPAATLYFTSLLSLPTSPSSTSVNAVVQCQCSARDLVVVMNNYSFIWHNLYFKH